MASTLEEMAQLFAIKTTNLKRSMELRSAGNSTNCISALRSIDKELLELEASLDILQDQVEKERSLLEQGEALQNISSKLSERLQHVASHLPTHLPGVEKKTKRSSEVEEETAKGTVHNPRKMPRQAKRATSASNISGSEFPKLAYLTVEEFEEVPKYIKGRISYEQVNNAIDEIRKAITAKYKIMRLPRSAMGEPVMKKYKAFKEAETPETEGEYFFIDDDLKTYSQLKMDATGRAILTMLRHCGRLGEVRGKKLLRYVLKQ